MPAEQRYLEHQDQQQGGPKGTGWSWSNRGRGAPGRSQAEEAADAFRAGDDLDAPVYVISVAAELAGLHPQTLRAYEREGLLRPARTEGGTRRYSRRDVERLQFIRTLTQDEGLNLAGVKVVLELGEKLEVSRRRIAELEEMVRVLAERVEDAPPSDHYQIVKAPPSGVEVHPLRRRTGERGASVPRSSGQRRARPMPPSSREVADV